MGLFQPVAGGDVRVVQGREGLRFAQKAGDTFRIGDERLRQDLDRDITIELGVTGSIDFAHAPATDRLGQLEGAETCAGSEGQRVGLYGRSDSADGTTRPHGEMAS